MLCCYISSFQHRPKTVFEVVAELWNSPDYNPVAPTSDCHTDFQMATVCSFDDIAGLSPATPQRVEDIFTSMRRELLLIMRRWEQSRQREGGRDNSDDDDEERLEEHREDERGALSADAAAADRSLGSLSGRPARALQSRAAFLNGKPAYLLYFWEVADTHQLLRSSLQCLNNGTGASDAASAAPSSHQRKRRRGQEEDEDYNDTNSEASYRTFLDGLNEIAESQRQSTLDRANDRQHEQQLQTETQVFRRKTELLDLARSVVQKVKCRAGPK